MNVPANEKSAYLKHAADQKIDWLPWSEEAFKKAEDEDKLYGFRRYIYAGVHENL